MQIHLFLDDCLLSPLPYQTERGLRTKALPHALIGVACAENKLSRAFDFGCQTVLTIASNFGSSP